MIFSFKLKGGLITPLPVIGRTAMVVGLVFGLSACSTPTEFPSLTGWYDQIMGTEDGVEEYVEDDFGVEPVSSPSAQASTGYAPPPAYPQTGYQPLASFPVSPGFAPPPAWAGGNALAEAYSRGLAASATTVTTAPANSAFAPSVAQRLPADLSGTVPAVVLETYNKAIAESVAALSGPSTAGEADKPTRATVYFSNGSARLSAKDRRELGKVVAEYRKNGGRILVVGHASSRTQNLPIERHKIINFEISVDRSNSVSNELLNQGVNPAHIFVEARSDSEPVYFEVMPSGEAGNRRVEISLR